LKKEGYLVWVSTLIWMLFESFLSVCLSDLILGSFFGNSQQFIILFSINILFWASWSSSAYTPESAKLFILVHHLINFIAYAWAIKFVMQNC
jgi:hypothetical protein